MNKHFLADVNLWLATLVQAHPHHGAALIWWQSVLVKEHPTVMFCRITQLGLLRLLCNETVMGSQRQTAQQAYANYSQLLEQSIIDFVPEPSGLEARLLAYCELGRSSKNFWTDAYLAAFASAGTMSLVTFDRGFQRFPDLELQLLS